MGRSNGELTLEIKPNFETPIGSFSPDKNLIPAINTRSFVSTVRLRDGETIVLGGVIQESEISSENKFPLLGDIPIIGKLFTTSEKSIRKGELMIYLTPRIFYGDEITSMYKKD
jgi:Type II secretory pathway, component HofQ